MAGNPAQDHVLLDTLLGRFAIGNGIPRTAVQQAVIPSRSTRRDIESLEQQRADSAQGAIAGYTGARRAAADNNHIELLCHDGIFVFDYFPNTKKRIKRKISK